MLYDGIKGRIKTRNIRNDRSATDNIIRWLRLQHCGPQDVHLVMEATGVYHERLATDLYDAGFCVSLANPHRSREFARGMGIMTKTDKVDAYMLACYALLKSHIAGSRRHLKSDISVRSYVAGMCCWAMPCVRRIAWKNTCQPIRLQMSSVPACAWRICFVKR